jgi:hypothetical protein
MGISTLLKLDLIMENSYAERTTINLGDLCMVSCPLRIHKMGNWLMDLVVLPKPRYDDDEVHGPMIP